MERIPANTESQVVLPVIVAGTRSMSGLKIKRELSPAVVIANRNVAVGIAVIADIVRSVVLSGCRHVFILKYAVQCARRPLKRKLCCSERPLILKVRDAALQVKLRLRRAAHQNKRQNQKSHDLFSLSSGGLTVHESLYMDYGKLT